MVQRSRRVRRLRLRSSRCELVQEAQRVPVSVPVELMPCSFWIRPMGQEESHHLLTAAASRQRQRRSPRRGGIHVGTRTPNHAREELELGTELWTSKKQPHDILVAALDSFVEGWTPSTAAPWSSKAAAQRSCPYLAAMRSGMSLSTSLLAARAESKKVSTPMRPSCAAMATGLCREESRTSGLAAARRSTLATSTAPMTAAWRSGVWPC